MYEMFEIIKKILLLIGLWYFAWKDYRTYYIGVRGAVFVGISGIVIKILMERNVMVMLEIGMSMLIGVGLIILALISKESIGIGDGILFFVSGCYLNIWENIILFWRTVFLIGGFAFICLAIKKKERIPMAPFMLTAYMTTL